MISYQAVQADIRALSNDILVVDMETTKERKTKSGIILADDNGKTTGIKPRWAKVYKIGKNIDYVKEGQWIYIEHGRWTYQYKLLTSDGEKNIQKVDTNCILMVSDENPLDI